MDFLAAPPRETRLSTHIRRKAQRAFCRSRPGLGLGIVAIQPLAHFLAGLEERNALLIDRNMGAGARIAAGTRGAMFHRESAETTELNPVAARQRSHDLIE